MKRVTEIKPASEWNLADAVDRVVLEADDRLRRRIVLTGVSGTRVLLDWVKPVALRNGDGLVLDDGSVVAVAGKHEPLLEISSRTTVDLVRLAWHLGNRHTDVQFAGDKLRIRRDHVLEDMIRGLGGTATAVEARFDPEPGHGHQHGEGS